MAKSIPVSSTTSLILGAKKLLLKGAALCAAAATSTLELFDGAIGTIATAAIGAGGTGYTALDVITLVQAGGGSQATVRVDTVDGSGVVTAFTILDGGTGYTAAATYATTGGTGTGFTVTASTISDAGVSVAKLSVTANLSAPPLNHYCDVVVYNGLSARITGSAALGHIIYD